MRYERLFAWATFALTSFSLGDVITVDDDGPADYDTIQEAIYSASDGDEIVVSPGTYHEMLDFQGRSLTLRGSSGPEGTIVDGTGFGYFGLECVQSASARIEALTFMNAGMGGIWVALSDATIENCVFESCDGPGVLVVECAPSIRNCTFNDNHAASGAGITVGSGGNPTVENCVFTNNSVSGFRREQWRRGHSLQWCQRHVHRLPVHGKLRHRSRRCHLRDGR